MRSHHLYDPCPVEAPRDLDFMDRTSEERLVVTGAGEGMLGTELKEIHSDNRQTMLTESDPGKSTTQDTMVDPLGSTTTGPRQLNAGALEYRTYRRRWYGFIELILLNIMVSWGWLTYAPVANTAAAFFSTTPAAVNWLVVGFFFAFPLASPIANYLLSRFGPKPSIIASAGLLIIGNWIRYGGTCASSPSYGAVMVGQIIIGFAQPFVLAAPTSYSERWFTTRGRITATAVTTLANPFGGALGSLIDPFIAVNPPDIAPMTLYVAIITTVLCLPALFVPNAPPTPVSPTSIVSRPPIMSQLRILCGSTSFWLLFIPFVIFVGFFNSFTTLLTQFLTPYGFSENDAGIAGAVLILVGLVAAAIASPLVDRYKSYMLLVKILIPIQALMYLLFIWAPPTRTDVFPYIVCAIIGATAFTAVPVALEWFVEFTYPVGPELTSVICWASAQVAAAIFITVSEALEAGADADPPFNMQKALIFQAVVALLGVPPVLLLGFVGDVRSKRLEASKAQLSNDRQESVADNV